MMVALFLAVAIYALQKTGSIHPKTIIGPSIRVNDDLVKDQLTLEADVSTPMPGECLVGLYK